MTAAARLKAGFGAGFALLLGVGISAALQTFKWEESTQSVAQANQAIQRLEELSLESKDAEDLARRFTATRNLPDLAECRAELLRAQEGAGGLTGPIEERPGLAAIRGLVDRQAGTLLAAIADPKTQAGDAAEMRAAVDSLDDARLSSVLRASIMEVEAREQAAIHDRALWQQRTAIISRILFALVALFSLVLVVAAGRRMTAEQETAGAANAAITSRADQYRRVVELAGDIIYRTDAEGRFVFCNQAALTLLHLSKAEVIGRSYLKLVRQDKRRAVERFYLRQFLRKQKNTYYEFPMIDGRGHARWIGQNVQLVFDDTRPEEITGFQAIAREITERKQAEQELKKSRRFVERIAATTPGVLYVYDLLDRRTVYSNREIIAVLGYKPDDLLRIEGIVQELVHPDDQAMLSAHHEALRQAGDGEIRRLEYRARHVDGHWVWLSSRDAAFERGPDGLVKQIVGIAEDISARKSAQNKPAQRANYDALTGLFNRQHFWSALQATLRRASLAGAGAAVCLFDIDHFEEINTRHGYSVGDEVLEAVGNIVRGELRSTDIAGRLGGDEFCIALPAADIAECARVAERIRERLASVSFGLASGSPFLVSATFAQAVSAPDGNAKELMEAADRALFRARAADRNEVLVNA